MKVTALIAYFTIWAGAVGSFLAPLCFGVGSLMIWLIDDLTLHPKFELSFAVIVAGMYMSVGLCYLAAFFASALILLHRTFIISTFWVPFLLAVPPVVVPIVAIKHRRLLSAMAGRIPSSLVKIQD